VGGLYTRLSIERPIVFANSTSPQFFFRMTEFLGQLMNGSGTQHVQDSSKMEKASSFVQRRKTAEKSRVRELGSSAQIYRRTLILFDSFSRTFCKLVDCKPKQISDGFTALSGQGMSAVGGRTNTSSHSVPGYISRSSPFPCCRRRTDERAYRL
jgi:hypothetical protein